MPLNITDVDAYLDLTGSVEETVSRTYRTRISRSINRFWQRLGAIAEEPSVLNFAAAELLNDLETHLIGLYEGSVSGFAQVFEAMFENRTSEQTAHFTVRKQIADDIRQAMAAWIRQNALENANTINQSVIAEARRLIARGIQNGQSIEEIANELASNRRLISRRQLRRIRRDPLAQARTIVRTEVMRAHTEGLREFLNRSGLDYDRKTWVTAADERVRSSHRVLHNKTIPYHAEFNVNGNRALWPRDARLPPGEFINCRCVLVAWERGQKGRPRITPSAQFGRPR